VNELFDRAYNIPGVKWVSASHASLSSAMSSPDTVRQVSKVLQLGTDLHPTKAFQVGIETGSPKLIKRHMKGKVYPFKAEEWPKVVEGAVKLFHENHIVSCATIIMGLPGEDQEDIQITIDLIKSLNHYQSLVVPLLFTPLETTRIEYAQPFLKTDLTTKHYELITACWDHNLYWFPLLWVNYSRDNHWAIKTIVKLLMKFGTEPVRKRYYKNARRHGADV